MRAELREPQIAAFVVVVEIDRHCEAAMGRAAGGIVAVRPEMPPFPGVVASGDVLLQTGGVEPEGFPNLRQQPRLDTLPHRDPRRLVLYLMIAPLLEQPVARPFRARRFVRVVLFFMLKR